MYIELVSSPSLIRMARAANVRLSPRRARLSSSAGGRRSASSASSAPRTRGVMATARRRRPARPHSALGQPRLGGFLFGLPLLLKLLGDDDGGVIGHRP